MTWSRIIYGWSVAALVVSASACNRNNRDDANDVGRGPGDETAQGHNTDPTVPQPGGPIIDQPQTTGEENTQGAPGTSPMDQDREGRTNTSDRQTDRGTRRGDDTLAGGATGGSSSGGKSSTSRPSKGTGGTGGASSRSARPDVEGRSDAR